MTVPGSKEALEITVEKKDSATTTDARRGLAFGAFLLGPHGRGLLYGAALLLALSGFLIGLGVASSSSERWLATWPEPPSIRQCMTDTLNLLGETQPRTVDLLHQLVGYCYSVIQSQGILRDFGTREINYAQQYRSNGIMMWMVVIVTMSGVLLAAVQLIASYHLALSSGTALGLTHEMSLKKDAVVLKSSMVGLFILMISFGFFLVFVLYVYRFDKQTISLNQSPAVSPADGLGPPLRREPK